MQNFSTDTRLYSSFILCAFADGCTDAKNMLTQKGKYQGAYRALKEAIFRNPSLENSVLGSLYSSGYAETLKNAPPIFVDYEYNITTEGNGLRVIGLGFY